VIVIHLGPAKVIDGVAYLPGWNGTSAAWVPVESISRVVDDQCVGALVYLRDGSTVRTTGTAREVSTAIWGVK
jgi:hypothetical protein